MMNHDDFFDYDFCGTEDDSEFDCGSPWSDVQSWMDEFDPDIDEGDIF